MMKRFLLVFIFTASAFTIFSQDKKYDLVTDRPDQTESSVTVPKGGLQIETGFLFENDEASDLTDKTITYNTTLFRYGLLDNLELRLGYDYFKNEFEKAGFDTPFDVTGLAPIMVGTKIAISEQNGLFPEMAMLSHLVLPNTGSKKLQQNMLSPEMILAAAWELNSTFSTGINLGVAWNNEKDKFVSPAEGFYSWALGIGINDKLGAFIETFGNFQRNEDFINNIDGGFTYLILPNLQFDVSGGFGVTDSATDYFVSTGLSLLLVK